MMRHNNAMQKMKLVIITFIFSGLLNISSTSLAVENSPNQTEPEIWYQIEVLVYEPVTQSLAGESWPAIVDNEIPDNVIELAAIETQPPQTEGKILVNAFQQLAPETLVLAETANKLINSRRYRIITLQGWQQPVKPRNEAESVHLTDKKIDVTETDTNPLPQAGTDITEQAAINEVSIETEEIPAKINGTVTVSLSRYLHMALKLAYYNPDVYLAEQIALQKPEEVLINTFMMKQSRRMRSKEVHVFDHPYFGVIATITPISRDM